MPDSYIDVSDHFSTLNLWGFITFMMPVGVMAFACLSGCVYMLCCRCSGSDLSETLMIQSASIMACNMLNLIALLITSAVWRWTHAGRVCSGDFDDQFTLW